MPKENQKPGEEDRPERTQAVPDDVAAGEPAASSAPNDTGTTDRVPCDDSTLTGGLPASTLAGNERPLTPSSRFGDYDLLAEVARGGMGIVYKARQLSLNRIVALKVIRSGRFSDDDELRRFQIEAQAAGQLDHPNIVPVHEVGSYDGQSYFTMGFVDGLSLSTLLADGPLSAHEAADLMFVTATAIHYAHQQGVIHRDLKPSNILLSRIGEGGSDSTRSRRYKRVSRFVPRVTDFGLALRVETSERLTVTGQILGTPSYMSPEQASGSTDIGSSTDVYSLGATLYQMLTGEPPFRSSSIVDTLRLVRVAEPDSLRQHNPGIPRDLETICLRCLEKEPHKRYATAGELAEDLERFLLGEPIQARPAARWERLWKWGRRKPAVALLALVFVASLIGGGVMLELLSRQRNEIDELKATFVGAIGEMEQFATFVQYREADFFDEARRSEREAAIANYEQLISVLERQVANSQSPAQFSELLASYYLNLGALKLTVGSPSTEESLLQAQRLFQELLEDDSANVRHRIGLTTSSYNLGEYYAGIGDMAQAESAFDQAWAQAELLPHEEQSKFQGRIQVERGLVHAHQGNHQEAEHALSAAESKLEQELAKNRNDAAVARQLGRVQFSLGLVCVQTERYREASDHYARALETQQTLVNRVGSSRFSRHDLATTLTNYGQAVWQLGDLPSASEYLQRSVEESRLLMELAPSDKAREILGRSTYQRASLLFSQGNFSESVLLLEESLDALDAIQVDPVADLPMLRFQVRNGLLRASLETADHQRAFEMVKKMLPDIPPTPHDLFQGASYCAHCATLAAGDDSILDADRVTHVDRYGDLAIQLLERAVEEGGDRSSLKRLSPEWEILRPRADFQDIIESRDD